MGAFPADEAKAFGLISLGAAAAAYAGAHKVIVKTPHESIGIPTKEANADGIKATKTVVKLLAEQKMPMNKELEQEIKMIKAETKCIIEGTYKAGNGDLAQGIVAAVKAGIIDIPFAPSAQNKGLCMPARDMDGRVRYLDFGKVPFTADIKKFHKAKLAARGKAQGRPVDFQMTADDIFAVSSGKLIGEAREKATTKKATTAKKTTVAKKPAAKPAAKKATAKKTTKK